MKRNCALCDKYVVPLANGICRTCTRVAKRKSFCLNIEHAGYLNPITDCNHPECVVEFVMES